MESVKSIDVFCHGCSQKFSHVPYWEDDGDNPGSEDGVCATYAECPRCPGGGWVYELEGDGEYSMSPPYRPGRKNHLPEQESTKEVIVEDWEREFWN